MDKMLNLEGVPEPVALGLEVLAEMARKYGRQPAAADRPRGLRLPTWNLGTVGALRREDIYDDC